MLYFSKNIGRHLRAHDLPAMELLEHYIGAVKIDRWLPDKGYDLFVNDLKEEILKRRGLELPTNFYYKDNDKLYLEALINSIKYAMRASTQQGTLIVKLTMGEAVEAVKHLEELSRILF